MRMGEKIYYCTKKPTPVGIEEYDAPVEITLQKHHCSVQPTSGYTAIQIYGEKIVNYQTVILQPYVRWIDVFKEGDLFYIEGKTPNSQIEDFYGELANFVVDKVFPQNESVRLVLKKRN